MISSHCGWRLLLGGVILSLAHFAGGPACAHPGEEGPELDFTRAPADTVLWGTLAKVGVKRSQGKLEREFLAPVRALAGKRLTLYGFVTAIDEKREPQRMFLLSSQPIFCRGCAQPVEPEGVVEINLAQPFDLWRHLDQSQTLVVRGKLELVEDDTKSVLYRLVDSTLPPERSSGKKSPQRQQPHH